MVCKYQGKVDWWSLKNDLHQTGVFKEKEFLDAALTMLGIKYGYWRLFLLGVRIVLGRALNAKDAHATPDSLFCSEFVSRCFRAASNDVLDVNPTANDASTSPRTSPPPGSSSRAAPSSTAATARPARRCSRRRPAKTKGRRALGRQDAPAPPGQVCGRAEVGRRRRQEGVDRRVGDLAHVGDLDVARGQVALAAVDDEAALLHARVEPLDGEEVGQAQRRDRVRLAAGVGERFEAEVGEHAADAQAARLR